MTFGEAIRMLLRNPTCPNLGYKSLMKKKNISENFQLYLSTISGFKLALY